LSFFLFSFSISLSLYIFFFFFFLFFLFFFFFPHSGLLFKEFVENELMKEKGIDCQMRTTGALSVARFEVEMEEMEETLQELRLSNYDFGGLSIWKNNENKRVEKAEVEKKEKKEEEGKNTRLLVLCFPHLTSISLPPFIHTFLSSSSSPSSFRLLFFFEVYKRFGFDSSKLIPYLRPGGETKGGLHQEIAGQFWPSRTVISLAKLLFEEKKIKNIFTHARVIKISPSSSSSSSPLMTEVLVVPEEDALEGKSSRKLKVISHHVVYATNAYTPSLLPSLEGIITPVRGQVLATSPSSLQLPFSLCINDGFEYVIQRREDDRVILGGMRWKSTQPGR
jgi:hypothetical protein